MNVWFDEIRGNEVIECSFVGKLSRYTKEQQAALLRGEEVQLDDADGTIIALSENQ